MYQTVIVDDEPYIVENLANAIDWSGYQLEIGCAATSPVKALEYILANPVDIVITDISMPEMNGLDMIKQIKQARPYIYVIVLSAYNNFEYARTALRYGAENYLLKPVDPDELSDTISQIVGHIHEREQLNSTYGQAMLTFRSAFTEQWVKDLLPPTEISTKAQLLGINFSVPVFTAVLFSCSKSSPDNMSRFFDLLLHRLPGRYTGNFFFETPTCLAGVLSPAEGQPKELKNFIRQTLHDASAAGITIFASTGPDVLHYSDVRLSYQQAKNYIWLEHTRLKSFHFQDHPGLFETVNIALDRYQKSFGEDTEEIRKLYKHYPPFACTAAFLSARIQLICKDCTRMSEDFPELCQRLVSLPFGSQQPEEFLTYTLEFLIYSEHLLAKIRQSMYPCVDAVIKNLQEFEDKNISLKTLAARLNVSPSYLGTVFHRQTGYYFNDYLTKIRLKKAAELLETTDMKIKDIVEIIGFSSQAYFTRSFKRNYNASPAAYRRGRHVENM